jgi:putative ABC transport system permease protein
MVRLAQDVRYGLRKLAGDPGFTLIAVVTLALGITANTTIFSWIHATLLDPIPGIRHTSNLYTVMRGERSEHPSPPFSYLDYVDLRDNNHSFVSLLAYHDDYMSITSGETPERIYGALTSANYFDVMGIRPLLGRFFVPDEERKAEGMAAAVISDRIWRTRFGALPSVIGQTIEINRHPYTIIGVAPPGFIGCKSGLRADIWIPLIMDRFVWGSNRPADRGTFWLNVLGKLKPSVTPNAAQSELNLLMHRIAEHSPNLHEGPNQITLDPLWRSPFGANVYFYKTLPMLWGLAAALLLLACANVANLLLVRSVTRRREFALRLSMGAGRWQLMRQLLVESIMLAVAGGFAAMLLTSWTAETFSAFIPAATLPLALNGYEDHTVLLVALLISVFTAVVFGTLPALRSSSLAPVAVLKEEAGSMTGGLHKSRLSGALVVTQIALSLLLLVCAGLFVRTMQNEQNSDMGFDPQHLAIGFVELAPSGYSRAAGLTFDHKVLTQLAAVPGVESVTLADFSPLDFTVHSDYIQVEGYIPRPHESMEVTRAIVAPNYFRTLKTPLLEGRGFTDNDDDETRPVAVVNQVFVDRYWPGQEALGKRIENLGTWYTVVGVAHNAKYRRLLYAPEPVFYIPIYQDYRDPQIIHVRVAGDPRTFCPVIKKTVYEIDPDLPVFNVMPVTTSIMFGSIFERIAGTLSGSFGLLALLLAAVGIYGVVSYSTRQRTHEIGLRVALGASRVQVLRMVLEQGLKLTLAGLALGLLLCLLVTRFLQGELLGVTATDPVTFASVAVLLFCVALIACFIPARRATKVEPMVALRYE